MNTEHRSFLYIPLTSPFQRLPFLPAILAVLLAGPFGDIHAQEAVNRAELEANQAPVSFINYEGPHGRIDSLAQIRGLGAALGTAVKGGAARAGEGARYFVIHSVSGPEGVRIDSDILGLGIDVGVDHIRNLRLIIQGYLEEAYGYSIADAALLAGYVTVYNAVFRGNWGYFQNRYKQPVVQNLLPEKAGLSTRFDEWPGKTLLLVPLGSAVLGSLSALDTTALTPPQVTEELRQEEDMGIAQRKDMVDLKEREAAQAEQRAAAQREETAEAEAELAQGREEVREARRQVQEERAAIEAERRRPEVAPPSDALEAREAAVDQADAALAQKEAEIAQKEKALEERREEARQDEALAAQKRDEAQEERAGIARDQQLLIDRGLIAVRPVSGVVVVRLFPDSPLGSIIRLDPATGRVLKASPLDSVNARTFTLLGDRILAVAGENRGPGAIRLIEIDPQTLEMAKQGEEDIAPSSLLWTRGNDLYAVTVSPEGLHLARFNPGLVREARSAVTIHPYAFLTFNGDSILVQRTDGSMTILDARDLTEL